jgi:hypothetical protein
LNRDDNGTGFGLEVDQLEREMMGLRFAFQKGDGDGADEEDDNDQKNDELRVEELDTLMLRMRAIKGRCPTFLSLKKKGDLIKMSGVTRYECRFTRVSTKGIRLESREGSNAGAMKYFANHVQLI